MTMTAGAFSAPRVLASGPLRTRAPLGVVLTVGVSLIAHVAALAVIMVEVEAQPRVRIQLPPERVITTRLVKYGTAGPRPRHWLPRLPVIAPPGPSRAAPVKPLAPPSRDPIKIPKGPSLSDRISRINYMQNALYRVAGPGQQVEKDWGSPYGHPDGTVTSFTEAVIGNTYITRVKDAIMRRYHVPKIITRSQCRQLKAIALIKIARDGLIVDMRIETTSGSTIFDNAVLRAIKLARRLPPPPSELAERMLKDGIELHAACMKK